MKKVYIGYSRPVGAKCLNYAQKNMVSGFELCNTMEECDIFISVMYDTLLKEDFIKGRECFNFHPGVLPAYRGAGAFTWSIINGENTAGITLHEIDSDIDTGALISVRQFDIKNNDTAYDLFLKGMDLIYAMFVESFHSLLRGEYSSHKAKKMPSSLYTRKMLDEKKDITNLVRAFTFPNKEGLYYYTSDGRKIFLEPFKGE